MLQNEAITAEHKAEIEDLRQIIYVLECKNKEFQDTINHHFYNQAKDYKEKVFGILKQTEDSRRNQKLMEIGIQPSSLRLNSMLNNDKQTRDTYPSYPFYANRGYSKDINFDYQNR